MSEEKTNIPPPTTFVGRLVPRGSALFLLRRRIPEPVAAATASGDLWVLVDGAAPSSLRWTLGLFALLVGFGFYNLVMIARAVRPVR
jgi:hypothetical protein